ncbi:MAG: hypothetical protein KAR20_12735 [Candidatus Heimdallarchaeota archaeon]|nr:hypothetical protein [Candidatus Heimdallarchaeota archaeon]
MIETALNPIVLRGLERMAIVVGAIALFYLGYRLFIFGITKGKGQFQAKSAILELVFSGSAPGLLFMFSSAGILLAALFTGGAESTLFETGHKSDIESMLSDIQHRQDEQGADLEVVIKALKKGENAESNIDVIIRVLRKYQDQQEELKKLKLNNRTPGFTFKNDTIGGIMLSGIPTIDSDCNWHDVLSKIRLLLLRNRSILDRLGPDKEQVGVSSISNRHKDEYFNLCELLLRNEIILHELEIDINELLEGRKEQRHQISPKENTQQ